MQRGDGETRQLDLSGWPAAIRSTSLTNSASSPAAEMTSRGPSLSESAEAQLVDYRGRRLAAFDIEGETLICLPQAYDSFLRQLVGGLHTVYTKLKRLEIAPYVCNVEQVRALRSAGAIQPGVNRCKLISRKDFDALYADCASSSSKPGRPPKRNSFFGTGLFETRDVLVPKKLKTRSDPDILTCNDVTSPSVNVRNAHKNVVEAPRLDAAVNGDRVESRMNAAAAALNFTGMPPIFAAGYPPGFYHTLLFNSISQSLANNGKVHFERNPTVPSSSSTESDQHEGTLNEWMRKPSDRNISSDEFVINLSHGARGDTAEEHRRRSKDSENEQQQSSKGSPKLSSECCEMFANDHDHQPAPERAPSSGCSDDGSCADQSPSHRTVDEKASNIVAEKSFQAGVIDEERRAQTADTDQREKASDVHSALASVHNLLTGVIRLIEVAAAAARTSEERLHMEKTEYKEAYEKEKSEKARIEKTLREEQRYKLLYMERWRRAKKQIAASVGFNKSVGNVSTAQGTSERVPETSSASADTNLATIVQTER